jgi:hypothetical protein
VGSGATIVGNTGDTLSLTGTSDNVFADSSSITVNGTDTGDVVHGNADTGNRTNWGGYVAASGAYGGYSGGGYYHGHGGSPVRANSLRIPRSGIEESAWADRAGSHLWRSDPTTQVHSAGWTVLPAGTAASIDQLIHAMASFNATQSTGVSDAVHPVGLFEQPQLAMPVNLRKPPLQVHGQL